MLPYPWCIVQQDCICMSVSYNIEGLAKPHAATFLCQIFPLPNPCRNIQELDCHDGVRQMDETTNDTGVTLNAPFGQKDCWDRVINKTFCHKQIYITMLLSFLMYKLQVEKYLAWLFWLYLTRIRYVKGCGLNKFKDTTT